MGILEKLSKAMELNEEKKNSVQALILMAKREWKDLDSHSELMKNWFKEGVGEIKSKEEKLKCVQQSVSQSAREVDARRLWIEEKMMELDRKEKLMKGLLQRMEAEQMQVGNLRDFVEEKMNDVALREKEFVGFSKKLDLIRDEMEKRENDLDSREKNVEMRENEVVLREVSVDRRERGINMEVKEFKIRKKEANLREEAVNRREDELLLKKKKLKMKENELGSKAKGLDVREKNVDQREHELEMERKKLERRENELDDTLLDLDRKQSELDKKGKFLEEKEKSLERREHEIESKEREFEGKGDDLSAKERMFRESVLDIQLKIVSILESPELFDKEPNADLTREQTQKSRKRFRNSAVASRKILDADDADCSNLAKRSCIDDKEAEQIKTHDLGESGASSVDMNQVDGLASSTQQNVVLDVCQSNCDSRDNLDTDQSSNPGALANDIGKEKLENRFNVGETWACFDVKDQMPRSYVQIRKVYNERGNFRLGVAWLRPFPWTPGDENVEKWLAAGCGTFKRARTSVESPNIFSHQVDCIEIQGYDYCILPKEGETWAIYKNRDIINRGSHPEFHSQCKYEMVEILSYRWDESSFIITVVYLEKLEGHGKSYWRRSRNENDSFLTGPNDFCRFSHKVISVRMNSNVADGFQDGTFEIEPKFLPPGL